MIELYTACREPSFPHPERQVAENEAARAAYARKHRDTAEARREIYIACELYRLAYNDGRRRAYAVARTPSDEDKVAVNQAIERQFGPAEPYRPNGR